MMCDKNIYAVIGIQSFVRIKSTQVVELFYIENYSEKLGCKAD
jgi:hypothetical protein